MSDDGKRLEYELLKLAYTEAMHGRWLWVADRSEVEVTGEDVAAAERTLDAFVDAILQREEREPDGWLLEVRGLYGEEPHDGERWEPSHVSFREMSPRQRASIYREGRVVPLYRAEHWSEQYVPATACGPALEWLRSLDHDDPQRAWEECERGDWMLWLAGWYAGEPGSDARRPIVLAATDCAALALPAWDAYAPDDDRPRVAIETARRWARGEEGVTLADVRGAVRAAYAAYPAAGAYAAYAAYASAYYAAALAAYAAADAADAADAARPRVLRECANIVRRYYPTYPREEVTDVEGADGHGAAGGTAAGTRGQDLRVMDAR